MPFAGFKDFQACVLANKDKDNPEAFCSAIHKQATGKFPSENNEQIKASSFAIDHPEILSSIQISAFQDQSTRKVLGVEIFKAGPQRDSIGREREWTSKELDVMLNNFNSGIVSSANLKLGHTSDEHTAKVAEELGLTSTLLMGDEGKGAAALGKITHMSRANGTLIADLEMPEKVANLISSGHFTTVSSEIALDYKGNGPAISGLALLGFQRPALGDLKGLSGVTIMEDGTKPDSLYVWEFRQREEDKGKRPRAKRVKGASSIKGKRYSDIADGIHEFNSISAVLESGNAASTQFRILQDDEVIGHIYGYLLDENNEFSVNGIRVRGGPNTIGASGVKAILRDVRAALPDISRITGFRISGAREAMGGGRTSISFSDIVDVLAGRNNFQLPGVSNAFSIIGQFKRGLISRDKVIDELDILINMDALGANSGSIFTIKSIKSRFLNGLEFPDMSGIFSETVDRLFVSASTSTYQVPVTEEARDESGIVTDRRVIVQHVRADSESEAKLSVLRIIERAASSFGSVVAQGLGLITVALIGGGVRSWLTGEPFKTATVGGFGSRSGKPRATNTTGRFLGSEADDLHNFVLGIPLLQTLGLFEVGKFLWNAALSHINKPDEHKFVRVWAEDIDQLNREVKIAEPEFNVVQAAVLQTIKQVALPFSEHSDDIYNFRAVDIKVTDSRSLPPLNPGDNDLIVSMAILDQLSGDEIGSIFGAVTGDELNIGRIDVQGGPGGIGASGIRQVVSQIKQLFPQVRRLTGFRVSGFRRGPLGQGAEDISVNLAEMVDDLYFSLISKQVDELVAMEV